MSTAPRPLIEVLLRYDALLAFGTGPLLLLAGGPLGDLFDLPVVLLRVIGVALLPWGWFLWWVARRSRQAPQLAWIVISANTLWVVASIVPLVSGWIEPSATGSALLVLQAILIAALVLMQALAVRRPAAIAQPTIT